MFSTWYSLWRISNLTKRTQSDKVLKGKAFEIASNPKCDGYQRELASMAFKFFDKNSKGSGIKSMPNQQLNKEFHKPITRKFLKRKVYFSFKINIWDVDLAEMQLIRKYNKEIRYLLFTIDLFSKYACVAPLKDKKGVTIENAIQNILNTSKRKSNNVWVDQGSKFYNSSSKKWLEDNVIKMYSTCNGGKSLLLENLLGL